MVNNDINNSTRKVMRVGSFHKKLAQCFAVAAFVVLFPGFYAYHFLVSTVSLPAVLGGYFGVVSVAILPLVSFAYLSLVNFKSLLFRIDLMYWAWVVFTVLWSFVASPYLISEKNWTDFYGGTVIAISVFQMIRVLPIEKKCAQVVLYVAYWLITGLVFFDTIGGSFRLGVESDMVTYQSFGLIYLVNALVCVACLQSFCGRWVICALSVISLYFIGARTEFLAGIFCISAFVLSEKERWVGLIALSLLSVGFYWYSPSLGFFEKNRINDLIYSSAEGSVAARAVANGSAFDSIIRSPVVGDFLNHPPGGYAHNVLSVWADFGVFGFAYFCLMLVVPLIIVFHHKGWEGGALRRMTIVLFLSCILMLFFSKYYLDLILPISLGLLANRAALSMQLESVK